MEEEEKENWCQNPHYAKIGKNWHWCHFWHYANFGINFGIRAKIATGAIFGTMPILALEQKLALVPILALVWCKLRPCRKIGIGANFGIGFWH